MLGTILIIILILALIGAFAGRGSASLQSYGWAPSGGLGVILLIVIVLVVIGRI